SCWRSPTLASMMACTTGIPRRSAFRWAGRSARSQWRSFCDQPTNANSRRTTFRRRCATVGRRWNRAGTPMVYASGSIALACLETIVHLGAGDLPLNRHLVQIEIPDEVWTAAVQFDAQTNVGWDAIRAGKVSLDAGESWSTSRSSALLVVPSVIVTEERNILINPLHPDATRIRA